ncbi:MAG: hypothetical protein IJE41_04590 [Clostridia bacterium]|nr:hypothetical protein [Clostridia bacterium]
MKNIIGIDGGGTKTEFVLCDENANVLKRTVLSSSNPVDIGMDNACTVLKTGIAELLKDNATIDGMFAGISGGSVSDNKKIIASYIKEAFPSAHFDNGTDAMNVISTGLKEDDGVILIAGTGCCAFARKGKELFRTGGWGYLFDGAGGGYDLGSAAISAVLKAYDETSPKTVLTELFKSQMNIDAPMEISRIYAGGKRFIASFAPLVFKGYEMDDAVSKEILEKTVNHWAIIITKAMEKVPHSKKVALAGSLFKQKDIVLPMLKEKLSEDCEIILPQLPPVYGAVREALKIAGVYPSQEIEDNFLRTYGGIVNE